MSAELIFWGGANILYLEWGTGYSVPVCQNSPCLCISLCKLHFNNNMCVCVYVYPPPPHTHSLHHHCPGHLWITATASSQVLQLPPLPPCPLPGRVPVQWPARSESTPGVGLLYSSCMEGPCVRVLQPVHCSLGLTSCCSCLPVLLPHPCSSSDPPGKLALAILAA